MAERQKLLYVVVQDVETDEPGSNVSSSNNRASPLFRYTRPLLQSTLQLMGCKPRHAFKVSDRVFDVLRSELPPKANKVSKSSEDNSSQPEEQGGGNDFQHLEHEELPLGLRKPPKISRKRSAVTVSREKFLDVVCEALEEYQYVGPNQRADLTLACRVRERKTSMTILLCGTSGCGKSTLSSLLASRLGITTVVSTDSVRHMMRSFVDEKENPLLWASTYHAGEYLDPEAVAEAKAKKKAAKMASLPLHNSSSESSLNGASALTPSESSANKNSSSIDATELLRNSSDSSSKGKISRADGSHDIVDVLVGSKTMAVQGFKAQSEMVIDSLDRLINAWELKCESVVVEGVHLSLNFVMGLMKRHPSVIPFMVYIANEGKHLERFAVRAKYMTLDPARNKYVKYIRNIRTIQEYLCKRADKHLVPKVNNTNVDKSVAAIHATIFSSLRRRERGEPLFDQATNTVKVVNQEYRSQYAASALGSKGMFQIIQRNGSSRHLMALMNVDGSVAKAWPIHKSSENGKLWSNGDDSEIGSPVYGPILGQIGKVEPVNLQFGSYGLSAWPNDVGGTSHHGSVDGQSARGDAFDVYSSYHGSSRSSSPRGDGADKDLLDEEVSVSGSEEEAEEGHRFGSDIENSDGEAEIAVDHEIEGSVDEESIRSDEDVEEFQLGFEAEDVDDGYWSDEVEERAETVDKAINGPPSVPLKGRTDRIQVQSGRAPAVRIQRHSSNASEESAQLPDLVPKPQTGRGVDHLTIAVPPFEARLHSRSRSSTVR